MHLSPLLSELRGAIDGVVFKHYGDQIIVTKHPDMSRVKRSPKQKAQLERMEWANYFYHSVMGDPVLQARYARRAKARKTTIHRLVTREYMARSKELGRVNVHSEVLAAARAAQKNG